MDLKPARLTTNPNVLKPEDVIGVRERLSGSEKNDFVVNLIHASAGDIVELVIPVDRFGDALYNDPLRTVVEPRAKLFWSFNYHDPKMQPGEPFSSYINFKNPDGSDRSSWPPFFEWFLTTKELRTIHEGQNEPKVVKSGNGQLSFYMHLGNSMKDKHINATSVASFLARYNNLDLTFVQNELSGKSPIDYIAVIVVDAKPILEGGVPDEDEGDIIIPRVSQSSERMIAPGTDDTIISEVKFLPPKLFYRK